MQLHADELRVRLEPLFRENFDKFGDLGAAISVWQNGKELLELHGGFRDARRQHPWTKDTLVLIWSATKGIGSACLLHVLQEQKIDIERWARFVRGQQGKWREVFIYFKHEESGIGPKLARQMNELIA